MYRQPWHSTAIDITFQGPTDDDIFFGIVQRGAAMIMLKEIGVDPVPNYTRVSKKALPDGTHTYA